MTLSIITVCYNDLDGLKKTRDSIISQTYRDFEWIVIDGGSTDGTKEYLEEHSSEMSYWCSERDKGVYNAMNKGIKKVKGEYILFLNSGDSLYAPYVLENVFLMEHGEDVIYGDAMFVRPDKSFRFTYNYDLSLMRWLDYSINHQSTFIKSYLFADGDYDESYRLVADWKRFVEWYLQGRLFLHVEMIVSNYDYCGMSSVNMHEVNEERERLFKEVLPKATYDLLTAWRSYQNKPCRQTQVYCKGSRLYNRLIRINLHFITWINNVLHLTKKVK